MKKNISTLFPVYKHSHKVWRIKFEVCYWVALSYMRSGFLSRRSSIHSSTPTTTRLCLGRTAWSLWTAGTSSSSWATRWPSLGRRSKSEYKQRFVVIERYCLCVKSYDWLWGWGAFAARYMTMEVYFSSCSTWQTMTSAVSCWELPRCLSGSVWSVTLVSSRSTM